MALAAPTLTRDDYLQRIADRIQPITDEDGAQAPLNAVQSEIVRRSRQNASTFSRLPL
jgi:hypothetical protein